MEGLVLPWGVFSAHAEVVPMFIIIPREEGRILRARGGSSDSGGAMLGSWGILRARGGSSMRAAIRLSSGSYSLRTRR